MSGNSSNVFSHCPDLKYSGNVRKNHEMSLNFVFNSCGPVVNDDGAPSL